MMTEPTEKQCPFPATYKYNWAGGAEISYACAPHAQQLAALCQHMGWNQQFIRLEPGEVRQCDQQLPADDPIFANQGEGG